jgi:hypothetical protein
MSNYARSTTATFSQSFLDANGNPLVAYSTNYPTVQILDPTNQIVASGVGSSTGTPGYYTWSWTVPTDATLGMGWFVQWDFLDTNQDNTQKKVAFGVVDQIETPDGLDRTAGYLSMKGYSERLIWKNDTNPISVQVTLKDTEGEDTWTKTYAAGDLSYVYADGYHVYYYDTTASTDHADEGQYLAVWRYQVSASNPFNNEVQWLVVPYDVFWYILPHMKMLVDKLNKVTTTPLSYLDLELWQSLHNGLGFLNSVYPFTDWVFNTVPESFCVWWYLAAGLFLLNSRQLLEIEVSHSLSGNTTSLEFDHSSPLGEVLSRWESMLWDKLPPAKLSAYRQSAGPGSVGVRPIRYGYQNRVYRMATTSSLVSDVSGIMSSLFYY